MNEQDLKVKAVHSHAKQAVLLYPYSISVLVGGGWSTPRPGRFTAGKESRYPRTGGWVGHGAALDVSEKSRLHRGFESQTMQPVVSLDTDYAIPAALRYLYNENYRFCTLYISSSSLPGGGGGGKRRWCTGTQTFSNQLYDSQIHCAKQLTGCWPRSVYECYLQLHLFNMRNHVFAVTYLKNFKPVIIQTAYAEGIFHRMEHRSGSVSQHRTKTKNFNLKYMVSAHPTTGATGCPSWKDLNDLGKHDR
jgi:hypothetical protein